MSARKEGDQIRKQLVFCQRLLSRDEFVEFCDGIRRSAIVALRAESSIGNTCNRLILPVDCLDRYPTFAWNSPKVGVSSRASWYAHAFRDNLPLSILGETLSPLAELNISEFEIRINTIAGRFKVGIHTQWEFRDGYPMCRSASIGLLHNVLHLADDYFNRSIVWDLDSKFAPNGFAKSLIEEAQLPFLRAIRLTSLEAGVGIQRDCVEDFWKSLAAWNDNEGKDMVSDVRVEFVIRKEDHHRWNARIVRELMKITGGREACLALRMSYPAVKEEHPRDEEYHRWLASIIGVRTLSGAAARYGVANTIDRRYPGEIWGYFVPGGVCLGYFEYEGRPSKPPKEVLALLPGLEWVRGAPPKGEEFSFPSIGSDECSEPLEGVDVKPAIKALRKEVAKWKARRPPPAPGSLEQQLEKLAEIGFEWGPHRDIQDLLDYREREWYELEPYVHLLQRMAMVRSNGRIRFVDFDKNQDKISLPELLYEIDVAGMVVVDYEGKHAGVNRPGERRVVEFHDRKFNDHLWSFDEPVERVTPEFLTKYDQMLQGWTDRFRGNLRLYSLTTGPRTLVIGAFNATELDQLNTLLARPFTLFNP